MNKAFIILFSLSLCVLLTGCWLFEGDADIDAIVKKGDYKLCDDLNTTDNPTRIDKCYEAVAEKTADYEICAKIKDPNYRDKCYGGIAVKKNDEKLCESVMNTIPKQECFTRVAISKKDKALCTKLTDKESKDRCFMEFAKSSNDATICRQDIVSPDFKDSCLWYVAQNTKNEALCKEISGLVSRDGCYYEVALKTDGNLLCAKIVDKARHDECFTSFAASRKDITQCKSIELKSYMWYDCIRRTAVAMKDKSVCKYNILEDKEQLKSCELQVNNAVAKDKASSN